MAAQPAEARISDFGLSARIEDAKNQLAGTQLFWAPETCKVDVEVWRLSRARFNFDILSTLSSVFSNVQGFKSDVWAAGVSLFIAATLRYPFPAARTKLDMIDNMARLLGQNAVPEFMRPFLTVKTDEIISLKKFLEITIIRDGMTQLSPEKRVELADLLEKIFVADPESRISSEAATQHPFFKTPAAV